MTQYIDCIVFLLAKAYQKSQNHLKTKLRPYGLTSVQALVLEALWEEQGLTAGEIGKRLALDNATVSGVLDRLAESRWIIKKNDPADKRVLRVYLSPKAVKQEAVLIEERTRANNEILSGFSDAEKILLKRFLKDLL